MNHHHNISQIITLKHTSLMSKSSHKHDKMNFYTLNKINNFLLNSLKNNIIKELLIQGYSNFEVAKLRVSFTHLSQTFHLSVKSVQH